MSIENGWFYEKNEQWPGQAMGLEIEEMLLQEKTLFQDLMVFKSKTWGKVLVLDGVIQLTERDEISYQEMLAHIPMFSHPTAPKKVLIIGGGDGGVLREVCKHAGVEKIVQCEIDVGVVNASKKFFPTVSRCFSDPRLELKIADAVKYVEDCPAECFDVVIVDSSDPVGPAEKLFSPEFYQNAHRILTKNGVMASQGESIWIHHDIMQKMMHENGSCFQSAEYASVQVPTYPCGQISLFVASKGLASCKLPRRSVADLCDAHTQTRGLSCLNYYSEEMHSAAFVLPTYMVRKLAQSCRKNNPDDNPQRDESPASGTPGNSS